VFLFSFCVPSLSYFCRFALLPPLSDCFITSPPPPTAKKKKNNNSGEGGRETCCRAAICKRRFCLPCISLALLEGLSPLRFLPPPPLQNANKCFRLRLSFSVISRPAPFQCFLFSFLWMVVVVFYVAAPRRSPSLPFPGVFFSLGFFFLALSAIDSQCAIHCVCRRWFSPLLFRRSAFCFCSR
jgi:hypothetical protein